MQFRFVQLRDLALRHRNRLLIYITALTVA